MEIYIRLILDKVLKHLHRNNKKNFRIKILNMWLKFEWDQWLSSYNQWLKSKEKLKTGD